RGVAHDGGLLGRGPQRGGTVVRPQRGNGHGNRHADHGDDDDQLRERVAARAAYDPPNAFRYHRTILSPQKSPAAPPAARKGPNGSGSFRPRSPEPIKAAARIPPPRAETKRLNNSTFQPSKAPSIAASLMSPPPIASRPASHD